MAPTRPASRRCWRRCAPACLAFRAARRSTSAGRPTPRGGGTLAFADGAAAELRREKKRGLRGKLADGKLGDVALTDELLKRRLGRPSAEMFANVFAFSLDYLARGGEALRDEGLRAAIAGAGLGAARSPQAVIEELRAQAESLFTVKGRAASSSTRR